MSKKKKEVVEVDKGKTREVMELKYDNEVAKYYVSSNADQTQFMLCIVTNRRMSNEDVLMALDVFVQDAHDEGMNVIDDPAHVGKDH